ncbi:MAG TPA: haloacid dehalogenase-like hydrolase [Bacteroidota bacterium]|nr:haloacid dehalogenase-like hydrolase [Bacteroidota bacterium]
MSILEDPTIATFLASHGRDGTAAPPLAVFDCDGTVIRGDIGEAMFYRQIERFLFRRSPAEIWSAHARRERLGELFDTLRPLGNGARRSHPAFDEFAALLLGWYFDGIAAGRVAEACADIVRLFAGYTSAEVRAIAHETFAGELASPVGSRRLGGRDLPRGVRYLAESVELLRALQSRGFDVWAVSGSNKWSVEPVFERLGVPASRVIGIELDAPGGTLSDRAAEPVPIREGKVAALRARTAEAPLLTASDSRNDLPLFLYSRGLKVRVNSRGRDTAEFFRAAGSGPDGSWVLVESPRELEGI